MSLKAELETWSNALTAYDAEDFERALDLFSRIADSSKILTNMGLIYATLGEHEAAVEQFNAATQLDQYLAVAYFQCGVSNFLLGRYELSLHDFDEALLYLRGNQTINYEQLGLRFKLFSAEVLFNRGLAHIYLDRIDLGLEDMQAARAEKATDEHNVIDDAITDRGEGYTVFSIPVGVLYRPSENKLKNAKTKDYMGKAKLIATSSVEEAYTEFSGVTRKQRAFGSAPDTSSAAASAGAGLSRSMTVPPPRNVDDLSPKAAANAGNLARSRTMMNSNERNQERQADMAMGNGGGGGGGGGANLGRSASARLGPGSERGAPIRGLSVRRPPQNGGGGGPAPPEKETRLTEIYDDYMTGYPEQGRRAASPPPPLPAPVPINNAGAGPGTGRVAAWARTNAVPANTPSRAQSVRAPSAYGGFSSSGSVRRRPTRRPTVGGGGGKGVPRSSAVSSYEEEEEGYVSGEYEEPMELVKIRVKLHYEDDMRGMTLAPDATLAEFMDAVAAKFRRGPDELALKFVDEDGGKISLRDESDFELAIETAREMSRGRAEGKLEVWVSDA
ncbi:hypothetical protein M0805_006020 [Coniferiporia weirii]|nr:hypothetical protein M0805_006020 [Coniferiporia weirii]